MRSENEIGRVRVPIMQTFPETWKRQAYTPDARHLVNKRKINFSILRTNATRNKQNIERRKQN